MLEWSSFFGYNVNTDTAKWGFAGEEKGGKIYGKTRVKSSQKSLS